MCYKNVLSNKQVMHSLTIVLLVYSGTLIEFTILFFKNEVYTIYTVC